MKEIKAFIKPNRVEYVVEALQIAGYDSVTLSKGEGTGAYKQKNASPSLEFNFTDSPVVKLELVCQNEDTDKVVRLICANAQTPERGDGIIYVTDIQNAFRIKTWEPFGK